MLLRGTSFPDYDNDFLNADFDYVSPDVDDAAILQEETSGRDGRGGVTFTPGNDDNPFAYPQYVQDNYDPDAVAIAGCYLDQLAVQGTLGGRLFTFIDGGEDIFGETTQIGVNVMSDNTLRIVRSIDQGTGVVLRGVDQAGDAQVELIGTTSALPASDCFIEVKVVAHGSNGSITVQVDNEDFYEITGINTAPSGRNSITGYALGGFCSNNVGGTTRHHEDLNAVLSDVHFGNSVIVAADAHNPTDLIGDHKWFKSEATADGALTEWEPTPVQDHYLNINENPPDDGTTLNATDVLDAKDDFETSDVSGSGPVKVMYRAYLRNPSDDACISDDPAEFEALVYMEEPTPGTCITSTSDTSACNLTDFVSRRGQTKCTIAVDGDKVSFKPNLVNQDGFWVGLSPLDVPPRVLVASGPTTYSSIVFNRLINMASVGARTDYLPPWFQPWQGLAISTQAMMDSINDFFQFQLTHIGIGIDVGLIDNVNAAGPFSPYATELIAPHFREDTIGSPYFWIGPSFAYNGETTYTYSETDKFKLIRNDPNIEIWQNAVLLESFTPGAVPLHLNPFIFAGRWGWDNAAIPPSYVLQPGIKQAFVSIAGSDCVTANYLYDCITPAPTFSNAGPGEVQQWGVEFDPGNGTVGDAQVIDADGPNSPNSVVFGYNENTLVEFSLAAGNVVITITDWVDYADNFDTVVGNVATYTYTRPYADTDNFVLQPPASGYPTGLPIFPDPSLESDWVDGVANQPMHLVVIVGGNSDYALPEHAGVKEVSFNFATDIQGPMSYAGFIRQGGVNKEGTEALAPPNFRFKRSGLMTNSSGDEMTMDDVNTGEHGYTRSS